jgi:hypothetical protein
MIPLESPAMPLCSADLWVKTSPEGEGDVERATRDFHRKGGAGESQTADIAEAPVVHHARQLSHRCNPVKVHKYNM